MYVQIDYKTQFLEEQNISSPISAKGCSRLSGTNFPTPSFHSKSLFVFLDPLTPSGVSRSLANAGFPASEPGPIMLWHVYDVLEPLQAD